MRRRWLFLYTVASHWVVLVTGGVVTACLTVLQSWRGKPFSWRFTKWVLFAFIAFACFLAWRDEYDRAQTLLEVRADLQGRLREREHRIEDLRSSKGSEEQRRATENLETANADLRAELRSAQQALSALRDSLKTRRLSHEERKNFTDVLAIHDGQQFGVMEVATSLGCQECMIYRDDIVRTINSVPGWQARSIVETTIRADVTGLVIGVNDANALPPKTPIIADALKAAGLPFTIGTVSFLSPDRVMLIIGNKP